MTCKIDKLMRMKYAIWLMAGIFLVSIGCSDAQTGKKKGSKEKLVLISTDYGDMKVRLYDETPLHKENFLKLAEEGFYDGLTFHRVIRNFMIQGGDPKSRTAEDGTPLGDGGPGYRLPAEFDTTLYHKKGALAAARQGDRANPQRESSGSQFYIVQGKQFNEQQLAGFANRSGVPYTQEQIETYKTIGGTPHLDHQYTVFGEVIEGLEVIDKIAAVQTGERDKPVEDVKMTMKVISE